MTAATLTLADLPRHPERGWPVDAETGDVYGVSPRWAGRQIGSVGSHGYRVTTVRGRAFLLHRVVWETCVGPIPPGMVINHKNGVKTDNRLANLEVVTSGQNNAHAVAIGLKVDHGVVGPGNWNYKVSREMHQAILYRLSVGESGESIARSLGLSGSTVSRIKRGVRCPS